MSHRHLAGDIGNCLAASVPFQVSGFLEYLHSVSCRRGKCHNVFHNLALTVTQWGLLHIPPVKAIEGFTQVQGEGNRLCPLMGRGVVLAPVSSRLPRNFCFCTSFYAVLKAAWETLFHKFVRCVCACVRACTSSFVSAGMHMEIREQLCCWSLPSILFETGLLLTSGYLKLAGSPACRDTAVSHSHLTVGDVAVSPSHLIAGITDAHHHSFTWILVIQTQIPALCGKHFNPLSHLPSPGKASNNRPYKLLHLG